MSRNAATWSPKNIADVRLMATSNDAGSKAWTWASAWRERRVDEAFLGRPATRVAEAARGQVDSQRRAGVRDTSRVPGRLPGAATDIEHSVVDLDRGLVEQSSVVGGHRAVEVVRVIGP